jgi:hypothetical protein
MVTGMFAHMRMSGDTMVKHGQRRRGEHQRVAALGQRLAERQQRDVAQRAPRYASTGGRRSRCFLDLLGPVHWARTIGAAGAAPKGISSRSGRILSGLHAAHARKQSETTPLPFVKAPTQVTVTPAERAAATKGRPLARRDGDRELVVVAAAEDVAPQVRRLRRTILAAGDRGTNSRSIRTQQARGVSDVAGIGQQAVGDVSRWRWRYRRATDRAWCAVAAVDSAWPAPHSTIRRGPPAARAPHPPIVPLTIAHPRPERPRGPKPLPRATRRRR